MDTSPTQPFRQLRRGSGLSIRTLSDRTGINRGRLSIIERGVMPTPDEARRIIQALSGQAPDAEVPS